MIYVLFISILSYGQITINEYSAANYDNYIDNYNNYEDWIELYGDRHFSDDNAIIGGISKISDQSFVYHFLMIISLVILILFISTKFELLSSILFLLSLYLLNFSK